MKVVNKARSRALLVVLLVGLVAGGCVPGSGAVRTPGWTVVAAREDTVYTILPTGRVVALDGLNDGAEIWAYPSEAQGGGLGCSFAKAQKDDGESLLGAVYGIPVITQSLLLAASYDHHLYAFDRASGQKAWDFAVDGAIVGGVVVDEGTAYFGSSDHNVYALDVDSQELVWDAPFETNNWVWSTPALDDKRVYVGSMDHYLYALDRESGLAQWKTDVGGSVIGTVVREDDLLYVGSVDKRLHVLRAEDGSEVWKTKELGGWVWGEVLAHDGYVYFCSLDGSVHAHSVKDGSPRWDPVKVEGAVRAGPALLGESMVVGTDAGFVYTVNMETGATEILEKLPGSVLSTPAVEGEMVYVGTSKGEVYALDSSSRAPQVWVYPPAKD
ncbi:MAG: PQQ-binding-like beta-propeller repeat protein [Chloroflexota bacterium]|nr:PQQ-binding-like beta-propeller repeat protein [Chloroflexota bacterium]